jgi:hypothetical protein
MTIGCGSLGNMRFLIPNILINVFPAQSSRPHVVSRRISLYSLTELPDPLCREGKYQRCKPGHRPNVPSPKASVALLLDLLRTAQQTCPSRRNKTGLLSLYCVPRDGTGSTNVLMVTSTVRMVDRIHGNTTSLGPAVALDGELVLGARCLCCLVSTCYPLLP